MTLAEFTNPNLLVPELLHERKESVIAELSKRLEESGRIKNARIFTHAVLKHESLVSCVFNQVAYPLARGHTAEELSFAIGLSQYGISWNKQEKSPVHAVVLSAIPISAGGEHLSLALTFSTLLHNKAFFYVLRQSKRPEEMFERLTRVEVGRMRRV